MTIPSLNETLLWFEANPWVSVILLAWIMAWKGMALWKSAGLRQKYWFLAILLINTIGILEIIYIFFVAKNYKVEVIEKSE